MSETSLNLKVAKTDNPHAHDYVYLSNSQIEPLKMISGENILIETEDDDIVLTVRPPVRNNSGDDVIGLTRQQMASLDVDEGDSVTVSKAPSHRSPFTIEGDEQVNNELSTLKSDNFTSNNTSSATGVGGGASSSSAQSESDAEVRPENTEGVRYDDVGGLNDELHKIKEMVELPLQKPELFEEFGVDPPKGVLLHGPPGTGKTLTAKAVANETSARFFNIQGPEIMSKYKGESEKELRKIFEQARRDGPAIIFFDEIDSLAPERGDSESDNRLVGQLLSLMDGMQSNEDVIVIGATNRVDSLDPALRRGGRFDREIKIGIPNETERLDILSVLAEDMPLSENVSLENLAEQTHGFVGADLDSLVREAGLNALQRVEMEEDTDSVVETEDFTHALANVEPSAMREFVSEEPSVDFDDVGGLNDIKENLRENIEWPLQYNGLFEDTNTSPPAGVILHGESGTGKTLVARALAGESEVNFIQVEGSELIDKYVGESEKAVREIFDKARQAAPSVLFFDEIDSIATPGQHEVTDRVISQILKEMDSVKDDPNITVLAATRDVDMLDERLTTPARFESTIELTVPNEDEKKEILEVHLRDKPVAEDVDTESIVELLDEGDTGSEIESMVRKASMRAIREKTREVGPEKANEQSDQIEITMEHFGEALNQVH